MLNRVTRNLTEGPYEADSWESYRQQRRENKKRVRFDFMPSPLEIKERIEFMRWMQHHKLGDTIINSVYYNDFPSIKTVKKLIRVLGIREAKVRLRILIDSCKKCKKVIT